MPYTQQEIAAKQAQLDRAPSGMSMLQLACSTQTGQCCINAGVTQMIQMICDWAASLMQAPHFRVLESSFQHGI
eukprot:1152307-Pelagomonas_calceolata.AAC.1